MELNLKKARKLESKISTLLSEKQIKSEAKVRVRGSLQEAKAELAKQERELADNMGNRLSLIDSKFDIRGLISKENNDSGINSLMNLREQLLAMITEYSKLIKSAEDNKLESDDELLDLLEAKKIKLEKGESYLRETETSASVGILGSSDIEAMKTTLSDIKKQLEDVEDQLNEKNLSSKIILDDEVVALLELNKLL